MTTYNHTPIEETDPVAADGATINAPLAELDEAIGDRTDLSTIEQSNLVAAVNEVISRIDEYDFIASLISGGLQLLVSDPMTDADSTELGSHVIPRNIPDTEWTAQRGTWKILSNLATGYGTSPGTPLFWIATVDLGLTDYYIKETITIDSSLTSRRTGVIVRYATGDETGYLIVCVADSAKMIIYKEEAGGVQTELASVDMTFSIGTDYVLFVAVVGDMISATCQGVTITATGCTINPTSTLAGIRMRAIGGGVTDFKAYAAPYLIVDEPVAYQVIQRDEDDLADIEISGTYGGSPVAIEARWNGGNWAVIDGNPASGAFSGTLASQPAGQGTLEVRMLGTNVSYLVPNVGIGDVFLTTGQSNASGHGDNNQFYSHPTLKACLLGNDYIWKEMLDPTDATTDQVDTVSADAAEPGGSIWPAMATELMAQTGFPVAIIPCSMGSTTISDWAPGADHLNRATLYGSMNYRGSLQSAGVRAVLLEIGESDALAETSEADFNTGLDTFANAVASDLGVGVMTCKIQDSTARDETNVNNAIATAWADNPNVLTGPDLSDIVLTAGGSGGGVHFYTDEQLTEVGERWAAAIIAEFE